MSIWKTLSAQFETQHINNPAYKPYYLAFMKVQKLSTDLQEHRAKTEKPGTLNEKGVLEAVRGFAEKNTVPELRRHQHRMERAEKNLQDRRRAITIPTPDKTDIVGAMLRAEIRAHIRTLDPAKVAGMLIVDPDPVVVSAVFEGPEFLSGVSGELRIRAEQAIVENANPVELAKIEEERELIHVANMAIEISVKMLREEAGFKNNSTGEFDKWMEKASEGVEAEVAAREGKAFAPDLDSMIEQVKAIPDYKDRYKLVDEILAMPLDLPARPPFNPKIAA